MLFSILMIVSAGSMAPDTINAAAYSEARPGLKEVLIEEAKSHEIWAKLLRRLAAEEALDAKGNIEILARVEKIEMSARSTEELAESARRMARRAQWDERVAANLSQGRFKIVIDRTLISKNSAARAAKTAENAAELARRAKHQPVRNIETNKKIASVSVRLDKIASRAQKLATEIGDREKLAEEAALKAETAALEKEMKSYISKL